MKREIRRISYAFAAIIWAVPALAQDISGIGAQVRRDINTIDEVLRNDSPTTKDKKICAAALADIREIRKTMPAAQDQEAIGLRLDMETAIQNAKKDKARRCTAG